MKIIDLSNQVFGRLTVIRKTDERTNNGSIKWLCRCSCGNLTKTVCTYLTKGKTKSCGCLQQENRKVCGRHTRNFSGMIINDILFLKRSDEKATENYKWFVRCPECKREDWVVTPSDVCSKGTTRCPECSKKSRISKTATMLLDKLENYITFPVLREYRINKCFFDGAIPQLNILIESDGTFWHSSLKQQRIDKHKNKLALENGFKLIRVKNDGPKDIDKAFEEVVTALDLNKINR